MGWFDWLFGGKGVPIGSDTVVKRMSAYKRDFKGAGQNELGHPSNVFVCGDVANTIGGKTRIRRLFPCKETVAAACMQLKKEQAELFYVSPLPFSLTFAWRNGGRVKMDVRFDTHAPSLPEWLLANVTKSGENVTAEALGRLLDGKFTSDALPEWLKVSGREDVAEPEPPPAPESVELKPGVVVFDHYRIDEELGTGGQGTVFLATDTQTVVEAHKRVVLKVLRCENCGDDASLQDFIREANTLSELRDDRIAACYWCKPLGKVPVLAMEYVEGVSLDKYLAERKGGKLDEAETRELLRPIAEALDYAHARGIFHRDVKPRNIIVRKTPKYGVRTCLLDFGIAGRGQEDGPQTMFWNVRGTLQYMSPEQKMVGRRPSASMDVYSLAVTAYECLAGTMPYPGGWERNVRPIPLASDTPFARSVMRGLAMLPENRPATCAELIEPKRATPPPVPQTASPTPPPLPPLSGVDGLNALERPFVLYRQLLAQSAERVEREKPEGAKWFKERQAELRDLTSDLGRADSDALVRFFREVGACVRSAHVSPDDFFPVTDRLVELRSSLPDGGGEVLQALKESIR